MRGIYFQKQPLINIQKRGGTVGKCEVVDRLKKNAIEEIISNMLKDGKTPEEIADFCHLDLKKVKEVQKKIQSMNF